MSSKGVWIMGMDHGVWIACGTGVWIGTLHFEPQPYIYIYIILYIILRNTLPNQNQFDGPVTGPDELPKIYVHSRFAYLCLTKQALFAHANVACHKWISQLRMSVTKFGSILLQQKNVSHWESLSWIASISGGHCALTKKSVTLRTSVLKASILGALCPKQKRVLHWQPLS